MLTRNGQTITWTSYNYPSRINKSGTEYDEFFYGPNRERWKQVYTNGSVIETTLTLGKFLEKVVAGGVTDWRHYLSAGGQTVAVYSRTSSVNTVRYVLGDHQGSIAALASSAGVLAVNESFTPFGQRRSGTTWQLPIAGADQTTLDGISRLGYTEHTHLGGAPLIHMNGRVQDPLTGRFLSADPYVTAPGSTQGWNRYSYVENDPATYTDPSGFEMEMCVTFLVPRTTYDMVFSGGAGGPDGAFGSGVHLYPHTTWEAHVSCHTAPEFAVVQRFDLDTPTYNANLPLGTTLDYLQGMAARVGNIAAQGVPWVLLFPDSSTFAPFDIPQTQRGQQGASLGQTGYLVGGVGGVVRKASTIAARGATTLARDLATGKIHGVLPKIEELMNASPAQIRENIEALRGSIRARTQELERLGEHGPHRARIGEEESLLRSLEGRLEDIFGARNAPP